MPVAQEHYWIALPPVLILVTCCCPQSYETTAQGLMVRAGFVRRLIPYAAITFIGPGWDGRASLALSLDRVKIRYGPLSELLIAPENPDAFYAAFNLGNALQRLGVLPEAIQAYDQALRIKPDLAGAHHNLATVYLRMGDYPSAAQHYQEALDLDPSLDQARQGLRTAQQAMRR